MAQTIQVAVERYGTEWVPMFEVAQTFGSLCNNVYKDWEKQEHLGQKGDTLKYRLPTQFVAKDGFATSADSGDWGDKYGFLTTDIIKHVKWAVNDASLATQDIDGLMEDFGAEMAAELAISVDATLAEEAAFGPYRWAGDVNAGSASMMSIQQLRLAHAIDENYGNLSSRVCVLPQDYATAITNTSLQEFTPVKNDDEAKHWKIGKINTAPNMDIYKSTLLPQHISGAAQDEGEVTITNVSTTMVQSPGTTSYTSASLVTLSGLTPSTNGIFKKNDIGDIGHSKQLKFVGLRGHMPTRIDAQFKVMEDADSDGSGNVTITVIPALIPFTGANPDGNITRSINVGAGSDKDKLRIVKNHSTGIIYIQNGLRFAAPRLHMKQQIATYIHQPSKESKISTRVYYGSDLNEPNNILVHDILYGKKMEPAFAMRLIFPFDAQLFG